MSELQVIPTGIPNLDTILGGGVPAYSLNIIAGKPGTGKTIMAQQILFNYVRDYPKAKALYLTTFSEPTIKVLRYMKHFSFFNANDFGERLLYRDLGRFIRDHPVTEVTEYVLSLVATNRPDLMAIDSFRAIRDMAQDASTFRRFCYELSTQLATARCTTFLLGEYTQNDVGEGIEFAVADGVFYLCRAAKQGEQQRFLEIDKLRGRPSEMVPFPFVISNDGLSVLTPTLSLKQRVQHLDQDDEIVQTGISGLDALLRGGIPRGHSVILSGVSGTGKTTSAMQFLVHGARQGERGLFLSFEEPPQRLRRMAHSFGWDLRAMEDQGLIRIIFVPQNDIRMEELIALLLREVDTFQPCRFVMDSFSIFLYRVQEAAVQRERASQLTTMIRQHDMVGLLISDIPASASESQLSRFGVEETVADGTIVLSTEMHARQRRRYLEVYKMRASDHVSGQHRFEITGHGIEVLYLPNRQTNRDESPQPLSFSPLRPMVRDELHYGSTWLLQGEEGVGKSTLAYQFAAEGLMRKEGVLLISSDMPVYQVLRDLEQWRMPLDAMLHSGQLRVLDTHPIIGKEYVYLQDMERFMYDLERHLQSMPRPCRLIIDSITPLALQYAPQEFVAFIEQKNRLLRQPNLALLDTILPGTLSDHISYSLRNNYDVVLDIYHPDWGEMEQTGQGLRVLKVNKARGVNITTRPYPYTIHSGVGVVMQEGFYGR